VANWLARVSDDGYRISGLAGLRPTHSILHTTFTLPHSSPDSLLSSTKWQLSLWEPGVRCSASDPTNRFPRVNARALCIATQNLSPPYIGTSPQVQCACKGKLCSSPLLSHCRELSLLRTATTADLRSMIQIRSSSKAAAAAAAAAYCRTPARDVEAVKCMCTSCFPAHREAQSRQFFDVGSSKGSELPWLDAQTASSYQGRQSVRLCKERWNIRLWLSTLR
jgi:hypothetical protein